MPNYFFSVWYRKCNRTFLFPFNYIFSIMNFYAVAKGRNPGIYRTWNDCKAQVDKFSGPIFKKFSTFNEADEFIKKHAGASVYSSTGKKSHVNNSNSTVKRYLSTSSDEEERSNTKRLKSNTTSKTKTQINGFTVDENGYTEVYTDGACSANGRCNARAGIGVWFGDDHPFNVSQAVVGRATNNMAEIQAVTVAARQAKKAGIKKLKINTDSQFLISCITQWMPKWKRNNWMTSTGNPVKNKTELIEMAEATASLQVSYNHVKGHDGNYGNEMADQLARNGCEGYNRYLQ